MQIKYYEKFEDFINRIHSDVYILLIKNEFFNRLSNLSFSLFNEDVETFLSICFHQQVKRFFKKPSENNEFFDISNFNYIHKDELVSMENYIEILLPLKKIKVESMEIFYNSIYNKKKKLNINLNSMISYTLFLGIDFRSMKRYNPPFNSENIIIRGKK